MQEKIEMPTAFWQSLSPSEFDRVCRTSVLDHRLCARLWLMLGLKTKPPRGLVVMLEKVQLKELGEKQRQ